MRQTLLLAPLLMLAAGATHIDENPSTASTPDSAGCVAFELIQSYSIVGPGVLHLLDGRGRATHVLTSPEDARAGLQRRVALAFPDGCVCPGDGRGVQMTMAGQPVSVVAVEARTGAGCPMPDQHSILRHQASLWCIAQAGAPI